MVSFQADLRGKMMRFGLRGKNEDLRAEAVRKIRANLGSRSIVLVGMPGSGKSAVGRRLASQLDLAFVDADEEIEQAAGKPIMDIFKDHGEAYFREGERKVIARLLSSGPQVLATGGGAFMVAETRDNIRRSGISVWLKAELSLLLRRVSRRNTRPLLEQDPEGTMRTLMETRYPIYQTADIAVESRDLPHDAIVGEIIDALAESPHLSQPEAAAQTPPVRVDDVP
jgi:shikimate kinase